MKWIVILIALPLWGCETPKPKHRHHAKHKATYCPPAKSDDVAMRALIKSLKEPNYNR